MQPVNRKSEEVSTEVIDDGAQDYQNPENTATRLDPEENPNPNARGEVATAGEGDGGDQEGVVKDEGDGEIENLKKTNAEYLARLEKLEKGTEKKEQEPPAYKEPTEEEWLKIEDDIGLSRKAIKFQASQMANLFNRVMSVFNSKFGRSDKENAISTLAKKKGFQDVGKFRKGMDEFLSEFDESMHSNEKILEKAYFYAKGKGTGDAVRQAANATERNRRIAGVGRPASPNSGDRSSPIQLTNQQRSLAKKSGMSEREYFDLLPQRRK